jgi:phospholipase/lecithinase/hemolysin
MGKNSAEAAVIADYNAQLAKAVSGFAANHTGAETYLFDAHTTFATILADPKKYGFADNTSFGQTNDFWGYVLLSVPPGIRSLQIRNSFHPSSKASVMIGQVSLPKYSLSSRS